MQAPVSWCVFTSVFHDLAKGMLNTRHSAIDRRLVVGNVFICFVLYTCMYIILVRGGGGTRSRIFVPTRMFVWCLNSSRSFKKALNPQFLCIAKSFKLWFYDVFFERPSHHHRTTLDIPLEKICTLSLLLKNRPPSLVFCHARLFFGIAYRQNCRRAPLLARLSQL